ncbi:hypothetical protein EJ110_NYTH41424 [Nymphaea thermarum]|nr:hypothetical protein EJ110_NYTH41424 [Nymphaea thermarum]
MSGGQVVEEDERTWGVGPFFIGKAVAGGKGWGQLGAASQGNDRRSQRPLDYPFLAVFLWLAAAPASKMAASRLMQRKPRGGNSRRIVDGGRFAAANPTMPAFGVAITGRGRRGGSGWRPRRLYLLVVTAEHRGLAAEGKREEEERLRPFEVARREEISSVVIRSDRKPETHVPALATESADIHFLRENAQTKPAVERQNQEAEARMEAFMADHSSLAAMMREILHHGRGMMPTSTDRTKSATKDELGRLLIRACLRQDTGDAERRRATPAKRRGSGEARSLPPRGRARIVDEVVVPESATSIGPDLGEGGSMMPSRTSHTSAEGRRRWSLTAEGGADGRETADVIGASSRADAVPTRRAGKELMVDPRLDLYVANFSCDRVEEEPGPSGTKELANALGVGQEQKEDDPDSAARDMRTTLLTQGAARSVEEDGTHLTCHTFAGYRGPWTSALGRGAGLAPTSVPEEVLGGQDSSADRFSAAATVPSVCVLPIAMAPRKDKHIAKDIESQEVTEEEMVVETAVEAPQPSMKDFMAILVRLQERLDNLEKKEDIRRVVERLDNIERRLLEAPSAAPPLPPASASHDVPSTSYTQQGGLSESAMRQMLNQMQQTIIQSVRPSNGKCLLSPPTREGRSATIAPPLQGDNAEFDEDKGEEHYQGGRKAQNRDRFPPRRQGGLDDRMPTWKLECPMFNGKNTRDWLYKVERNPNIGWADFRAAMMRRFEDSRFADFNVQLKSLTQTSSVIDYQDQFESLACLVTGWDDEALVGVFIGGLQLEIQLSVLGQPSRELQECMRVARHKEDKMRRKQEIRKSYKDVQREKKHYEKPPSPRAIKPASGKTHEG